MGFLDIVGAGYLWNKVKAVTDSISNTLSTHTTNTGIHLTPEEKSDVDRIPLICSTVSSKTSYCVDLYGGNDLNSGLDKNNAFKTLDKAFAMIPSTSTVGNDYTINIIGEYGDSLQVSTLQNKHGTTVHIMPCNHLNSLGAIRIKKCSHVIIEMLTIDVNIYAEDTTYLEVKGCRILSTDIRGAIQCYNTSVRVYECTCIAISNPITVLYADVNSRGAVCSMHGDAKYAVVSKGYSTIVYAKKFGDLRSSVSDTSTEPGSICTII